MEREASEELLIGQAREGDREAFERLVAVYGPRIRAVARARLGPALRPAVDVDDVLQETYLRAFQSLPRFSRRNEDSFFCWLSGIAANVIRTFANERKHHAASDEIAAQDISPSKVLRRDERFERLEQALGELPPDYREVILLARVKGLPIEEVARRMKRSSNAVSLLLLRATRKLRTTFGDTESLHLPDRTLGVEGDTRGS